MLETIVKTVKKSLIGLCLSATLASNFSCGGDTFGGASMQSQPDAGSDAKICEDNDGDSFYKQQGCGTELDCDDNNNRVFPNEIEFCDYIDNNCDGQIDEGAGITFYADQDKDGSGNRAETRQSCFDSKDKPKGLLEGYVDNHGDCDDTNPTIYGGILEEQCCGFNGEGIKTRTCLDGEWTDFGDCSIENLVNASNNNGDSFTIPEAGSRDYIPDVEDEKLVYISTRTPCNFMTYAGFPSGCSRIFLQDLQNLDLEPVEISEDLPVTHIDTDIFSGGEWDYYCNHVSFSGSKVAFECTWRDSDTASSSEYYYGFLYLSDWSSGSRIDFWNQDNRFLRGFCPDVSEEVMVAGIDPRAYNRDSAGARSDGSVFRREDGGWKDVVRDIKTFDSNGELVTNFGEGMRCPVVDGSYTAFESERDGGDSRIYLGNRDTGVASEISDGRGYEPVINGNNVVFTSERDLNKQLYRYNIATGGLERLTIDCGNNYEPNVRGDKISFTSDRDGNNEIYVCDLATTSYCCDGARNISNSPASDYNSSISACRVAFVSDRTGDEEIFVYDLCEGGCGEK